MRNHRPFVRPRLSILLGLLCILLAVIGSAAFFTDRITKQTGVTLNVDVGEGNLIFIDTSSNSTDDNGNKSNNPTALDKVWNGALISDDGNLNPGDFFDLSYALDNTGSKSIDVRQQLVVTSTVPMTENAEEYYLTILYDGVVTPVPGELSDDGLTLTYDLPDMIFNGTSEEETGGLGRTDFNVRLTFLREAKNAFMRSGVNVTFRVQAKGHRESTDEDWSDWAELDTLAGLEGATLESITVTAPTGYAYVEEGTNFDKSAVTVKAHFDTGAELVINDFDVIGGEAMTRDKTKVTISYTKGDVTKTADLDVRVVVPVAIDSSNRSYAGYTGAADEDLEIKDFFYDETKGYWCKATSIGTSAFEDCTSLTSVKLPESIKTIEKEAFKDCTSLASIDFGAGVETIGDYAFNKCANLTTVAIPDRVKSVGQYAFAGCSNLTSLYLGNSVKDIGYYAFDGTNLTGNLEIPDSVEVINSGAFRGCSNLTSVDLGNSVTLIGVYSFQNCTNLTSITIPDSVTTIDDVAFAGCTGLTSLDLGSGVKTIGSAAFSGCSALTDVYYAGNETQWNVISIGSSNAPLTNATKHYNSTMPQ